MAKKKASKKPPSRKPASKGKAKSDQSKGEPLDLDKIIEEEGKALNLTPTNLRRGSLVSDAVSTGSLAADLITGGGFAPSRRSNIFGREQVGKSTFLYNAVKACIAQGIYTLFYDFEGATDAERVNRMGVQVEWFKELEKKEPVLFRYYDTMEHGEQAFRHARRILDRLPNKEVGKVQVAFFLDSLPTVPPKGQVDDDESKQDAMRASMYSKMLPLVKSRIAAKRCIWIDVNQIRTNPRQGGFGSPEYEPCGEAVRTLSDCRIKAKKTIPPPKRGRAEKKAYIEEEPCWDGFGVDRYTFAHLTVTKNKAFSPFRECTVRMWFEEAGESGRGVDPVFDVWQYLKLTGQFVYRTKQFHISLPPFNQEREVKIPIWDDKAKDHKYDPDTGEIMYKTERKSAWTWKELKDLILNPENLKGKGRKQWDIVAVCRKQIRDESAFALYAKARIMESQRNAAKKEAEEADG